MDVIVLCTILVFCLSFLIAKRMNNKGDDFRNYTYKNGVIYNKSGEQVGIYFRRTMVLNKKYIDYCDQSPEDYRYLKEVTELGGYDGHNGY